MADTANIIISHQSPACISRMLEWWKTKTPEHSLWIAYGGKREVFDSIPWQNKFYLESSRIRIKDAQREKQGYHEIFQLAAQQGIPQRHAYIHLAEFDQIPLQPSLNDLQTRRLLELNADVLAYHLKRVDGTNHPHYLNHSMNPKFHEFFRSLSIRDQKDVVLSFVGFGSFWKSEAFAAVAEIQEPFPIYLELWMPSVAHHLGFRIRRIDEPAQYNHVDGDAAHLLAEAAAAGIWNLHPAKQQWNDTTT